MRAWHALAWLGLAVPACVLPSVEVDENFSPGGAGGSRAQTGGTAGAGGTAGRGGSAGNQAMAGRGGSAGAGSDPREDACINYCATYIQACATHEANTYADVSACGLTCATAGWPFDTSSGAAEAPNSLQCRRLHAAFALDAPEFHCFHSSEFPSNGKCEAE